MGREIRRVPANWKHPEHKYCPHLNGKQWSHGNFPCFEPKFDRNYKKAVSGWYSEASKYKDGYMKEHDCYFHEWDGGPPEQERYVDYDPDSLGEDAWYCLYETVSEGTPVTPAFATREELADYLAEHGDYWDQRRRQEGNSPMDCRPWGKEMAYKFVFGNGWAPSMVMTNGKMESGVQFVTKDSK